MQHLLRLKQQVHLIADIGGEHLGEASMLILEASFGDGLDEFDVLRVVPLVDTGNHISEHDKASGIANAVAFLVRLK